MKVNKTRIRVGRMMYFLFAILFTLCIGIQVYFAGMAIFEHPMHWNKHLMFVHVFGFNLPILMLISAIIGRLPRWAYWQLFWLFASIFLMYFTANNTVLPWLGSLHPVIAIIMFVLSLLIVFKAWTLIINNSEGEAR